MTYIPVITFVVAVLALIGMAINKIAEKVSEKPSRLLAAAVVVLFVFIFLGSLAYADECEWQGATVNGSIEVTLDGKTMYLVAYTTDDGYVLTYYDDVEIQRGTRIKVLISPSWKTLDAKVEEPEPIWFPPVLLLGAIVPVEKKFKRMQKMPPDFYLPCSLFDKNTFVVYFANGKKCFVKTAIDEAFGYMKRAEAKSIASFICSYVEEYKQQAVIACNYCDFLEYWKGTTISDRINEAYKKLDVQLIPKTAMHKPISSESNIARTPATDVKVISDKDDPFVQVVEVKYSDNDDRTFMFRCRQAHTPGDYVCVFTKRAGEATKTYKNVKVVKYTVIKESEVKVLAKSLGYSDISEVYCDKAVDIPEAWSNWRDPADNPELYAPSAEEIAEFEAMREAYSPAGYRDF